MLEIKSYCILNFSKEIIIKSQTDPNWTLTNRRMFETTHSISHDNQIKSSILASQRQLVPSSDSINKFLTDCERQSYSLTILQAPVKELPPVEPLAVKIKLYFSLQFEMPHSISL